MNIQFIKPSAETFINYPTPDAYILKVLKEQPDSDEAQALIAESKVLEMWAIEHPLNNFPINLALITTFHPKRTMANQHDEMPQKGDASMAICFHTGIENLAWGYNHYEDFEKDLKALNELIKPLSEVGPKASRLEINNAYELGYQNFDDGVPWEGNPYSQDSELSEAWDNGWKKSEEEDY